MIIKEWKCLQDGFFENEDGKCPTCGNTGLRVHLTATAYKSAKTRLTDQNMQDLANQFNLTNMSNKNGPVGGVNRDGWGKTHGLPFQNEKLLQEAKPVEFLNANAIGYKDDRLKTMFDGYKRMGVPTSRTIQDPDKKAVK